MQKFEAWFLFAGGGSEHVLLSEEEQETVVRWFRRDPVEEVLLIPNDDPEVLTLPLEGGKGLLLIDRSRLVGVKLWGRVATPAAG